MSTHQKYKSCIPIFFVCAVLIFFFVKLVNISSMMLVFMNFGFYIIFLLLDGMTVKVFMIIIFRIFRRRRELGSSK